MKKLVKSSNNKVMNLHQFRSITGQSSDGIDHKEVKKYIYSSFIYMKNICCKFH